MKVMTILGSPRKDGNTNKALQWVEKTLQDEGHEIDRVNVVDFTMQGCQECWSCKTDGSPFDFCAINDDALPIFNRMMEVDCILFATPVFCWSVPAQLKTLIDRLYCMVEDYRKNPAYKSKLQGKPIALLVTAGGGERDNADLVKKMFGQMAQFLKSEPIGYFLVPYCKSPDSLGGVNQEGATAFAKDIHTKIKKVDLP